MPAPERADIFYETADRKNLPEAVIEKDFWVCWILKQLFSNRCFDRKLLFKGGTSLSKVFHAINRFSEDIDLAVDYAALGFTGDRDPKRDGLSRTRQVKILADMLAECQRYIRCEFIDELRARCHEALGTDGLWRLTVSEQDPNVVRFSYPPSISERRGYVLPHVILELGTHAEFVPRGNFVIRALIAEEFPNLFDDAEVDVVALLAKRTFWEKLTILHAEHHRPLEKALPARYSRHYYDVAMLAQGPIKAEALADTELLAQVVRHKEAFYASGWSRYDLARPGTIRALPVQQRLAALRQDYRAMAPMIFGQAPAFETVLETLAQLERDVNSLPSR